MPTFLGDLSDIAVEQTREARIVGPASASWVQAPERATDAVERFAALDSLAYSRLLTTCDLR
jgi:hypothetical protein